MADIKFNMPIRYLIFFPFFLLLCPIAHAAIGIDSSSTSWYATSTNLTTITVTSSQSNQLLVVSLWDFASIAPTATAVTAGGVTMTQAAAVEEQGSVSGDSWNYIYYLTAPSTGLVNVTTTWSSPPSGAVTQIVSLYNVAQSSPVDASSTSVGQTAHNVSTTVTTVTNNDIIIDSAGTKASSTGWAVGTGQTQLSGQQARRSWDKVTNRWRPQGPLRPMGWRVTPIGPRLPLPSSSTLLLFRRQ